MERQDLQSITTEEEILNEEEIYSYLAAEQAREQGEQELKALYNKGMTYKHPSYFKYWILMSIAASIDIVDTFDVSGISLIITRFFSIACYGLMIAILWFTNTKLKKAQEYTKNLEKEVVRIQQNIQQASRMAMATARTLRRVPGGRTIARQIPRTLVRIRRAARKNPITKVLISAGVDLIPFVAILNLAVVWVYLSYRDEKKMYQNTREAAADAYQQLTPETV